MSKQLQQSAALMRKLLASIDLDEVKKQAKISDIEASERAGDAETFYTSHFKKVINALINEQLLFIAKEATDDYKLQFARGTINGFTLLKEWFEEQAGISQSRFDKKDEDKPVEEQINPMEGD